TPGSRRSPLSLHDALPISAISLVLAGGLVGGILGPGVSRWTIDLFDVRFMGSYLSLTAFALVTVALLRFIRIPPPAAGEQSSSRSEEHTSELQSLAYLVCR